MSHIKIEQGLPNNTVAQKPCESIEAPGDAQKLAEEIDALPAVRSLQLFMRQAIQKKRLENRALQKQTQNSSKAAKIFEEII
jgi:hypothetical protein